jgi:TRAP-type mannitol/chloroaromatic compound transport system permease large subunit
MEFEYLAAWMFLALTIWLMVGFPVTFTLLGTGLFFGLWGAGFDFFGLLPLRIWGVMNNVMLMAVPLFVFMGVTLEKSGIAEELLDTMGKLFGPLRGGLAISAVVVGALLGASTGIVGATVVTMGLLAVPTMLRRGYSKELATGTVSASGTLGQIIPPSIVLVLLATIVQVPVGDLFMAAVFPGLILVVLYIIWIIIAVLIKPKIAPPIPMDELGDVVPENLMVSVLLGIVLPFVWIAGAIFLLVTLPGGPWLTAIAILIGTFLVLGVNYKHNWTFFLWIGKALFPPILLIIFVLGSIFAGLASPTEAAAVGCVVAVVLAIFKGKFNLKMLREVNIATTKLTCMVFIILVGASAFGLTFRELDGDELVRNFLFSIEHKYDKWVVLAIVMGIIFLVGFVLDFIEITFIHVPVLVPILIEDFGFNGLWVCVLLAVNLQTSFMTPPFGFSLFYLKAVTPPEVRTGHIYRGIIPFVAFQIIGLFIVAFWPELATWLPSIVYAQ